MVLILLLVGCFGLVAGQDCGNGMVTGQEECDTGCNPENDCSLTGCVNCLVLNGWECPDPFTSCNRLPAYCPEINSVMNGQFNAWEPCSKLMPHVLTVVMMGTRRRRNS